MATCRICGNARGNHRFTAREMMFGTREPFDYFECARCGCVQIARYPRDIKRHYPAQYYSYRELIDPPQPMLRRWLRRQRLENILGRHNIIGALYQLKAGRPTYYHWFQTAGVRPGYAIADVGCGNGQLLVELHREGFGPLVGLEPYLPRDIQYAPELTIYRELPGDLAAEAFDLVMLHHSLEHMPGQREQLRQLYHLLRPDRYLLVRVPVCNHAWKTYGVNWVQLDAPRHFYLHTERSLTLLAEQAGFAVGKIEYDSNAMQFWGSEQYRRGIPLQGPTSYPVNPAAAPFTAAQIAQYRLDADRLNREGRGDQACFYLFKREGGDDGGN